MTTGCIRPYAITDFNLDQINPGRSLFALLRETGDARYERVIHRLREQLTWQPRTREGGFWHKLIYPHQIWLDGVYMAGPFLAEYAATFDEPEAFDEVTREILLVEQHLRDPRHGPLLSWLGREPIAALGESRDRLLAALLGPGHRLVCDGDRGRARLLCPRRIPSETTSSRSWAAWLRPWRACRIRRAASGIRSSTRASGPATTWNRRRRACSSTPSRRVCAGATLDASCLAIAQRGYVGILRQFVVVDEQGVVSLTNVCSVGGLGGNPYRDGSFEYYISEKVVTNDYKGVGSFILASIEIEAA